jgi:6-phosphogluconolactonase (cycloisomerase 2 family)
VIFLEEQQMTQQVSRAVLVMVTVLAATVGPQARTSGASGAVYTVTNSVNGNSVLVFDRTADGGLAYVDAVATGGPGSGNGLGNQGGVALTADGKFVLVVNAGSHDVSVLQTTDTGLILADRKNSGGVRPISVAVSGRLVYVLNNGSFTGGRDTVVGFRLSRDGVLTQLAASTRGLSAAAVGPAEVAFSADGATLIVTEKATSRLDVFDVLDDGLLGAANVFASSGSTPFGFAFGKHDQFFVSEAFGGAANASALSSYQVTGAAAISLVSPSVPTTETAACWVAVTPDGRHAYTTNAGSGTVSGYRISPDGAIALLDADGVTGMTGAGVTDVTVTNNGRYLYALRSGAGVIAMFRIEDHGALTSLGSIALPAGANGIAAR